MEYQIAQSTFSIDDTDSLRSGVLNPNLGIKNPSAISRINSKPLFSQLTTNVDTGCAIEAYGEIIDPKKMKEVAYIGRGLNGLVYEMITPKKQHVAVKIVRNQITTVESRYNLISIMMRIRHPCIIKCLGFVPPSSHDVYDSTEV